MTALKTRPLQSVQWCGGVLHTKKRYNTSRTTCRGARRRMARTCCPLRWTTHRWGRPRGCWVALAMQMMLHWAPSCACWTPHRPCTASATHRQVNVPAAYSNSHCMARMQTAAQHRALYACCLCICTKVYMREQHRCNSGVCSLSFVQPMSSDIDAALSAVLLVMVMAWVLLGNGEEIQCSTDQ